MVEVLADEEVAVAPGEQQQWNSVKTGCGPGENPGQNPQISHVSVCRYIITSAGESFPFGAWPVFWLLACGQSESREKGGVTGVTDDAGIKRGGGEGASKHWSPS